jgi:hypothetical protein
MTKNGKQWLIVAVLLLGSVVALVINYNLRFMATPIIHPIRREWTLANGKFIVEMAPKRSGILGTVEFVPDPANCPPCARIRLVQVVKAVTDDGSDYDDWVVGEQNRRLLRGPNGWFVDHKAAKWSRGDTNANIYFNESFPVPGTQSRDGSKQGDSITSAMLYDAPGGDRMYRFFAETAVRCDDINSPTNAQYLGFVHWGFIRAGNRMGEFQPIDGSETPTLDFSTALEKFNGFYGTSY